MFLTCDPVLCTWIVWQIEEQSDRSIDCWIVDTDRRTHGQMSVLTCMHALTQQLAPYEEAVTGATGRSYFHVKPLSDSQKAAWHDYISFALTQRADNTDFVVSVAVL